MRDEWMKKYPSVIVNRSIKGDKEYATSFYGEGNKLLYQLKNLMMFRDLGQLKMTRNFTDGTIITASSVFGRDQITIDVSRSISGIPFCSITLFNIPEEVPPMMWYNDGVHDEEWLTNNPGGEVEVEGVDYIKTYYEFNLMNFQEEVPDFTICETEELAEDEGYLEEGEEKNCIPFKFDKPAGIPYYLGNPYASPQIPPDPENHCLHSLSNCQAEIIKFGSDENGKYFIWKAYTEWTNLGPYNVEFSQTGLGYMLLKGFGKFKENEICASEGNVVKVDCCLKSIEKREVILWDEATVFGVSRIFMWEGGNKFYKTPDVISAVALFQYSLYETGLFWVFPEIFGSCIPFEWTLNGPGELNVFPDNIGASATYYISLSDFSANEDVTITVKDRCGNEDQLLASCCLSAYPLSAGYTSLIMACGGIQEIVVSGGCKPYSWSLNGGGILTPYGSGNYQALYEAPATNPNCTLNPTITITDFCESSTQIQLAINCYTDDVMAYRYCTYLNCEDTCPVNWRGTFCQWSYRCDGTLKSQNFWDINSYSECGCRPGLGTSLACPVSSWLSPNCGGALYYCGTQDCDTVKDWRTDPMKTAGCCPINPLTGLPF